MKSPHRGPRQQEPRLVDLRKVVRPQEIGFYYEGHRTHDGLLEFRTRHCHPSALSQELKFHEIKPLVAVCVQGSKSRRHVAEDLTDVVDIARWEKARKVG